MVGLYAGRIRQYRKVLILEKYVINGATTLHGEVEISGAKNAAVAIIPAALMVDGVCCIENIPQISDTDMLLTILKELGAKFVVSRAERDVQAKFLLRNGADEVVYPEKQLAKWAAIRYSSDHILDYIELQDDHAIMEVTIPPEWIDKSIGTIDIRKRYNINILAVKKDGKLDMNITPDTVLSRNESMLVLGKYDVIQRCFRL